MFPSRNIYPIDHSYSCSIQNHFTSYFSYFLNKRSFSLSFIVLPSCGHLKWPVEPSRLNLVVVRPSWLGPNCRERWAQLSGTNYPTAQPSCQVPNKQQIPSLNCFHPVSFLQFKIEQTAWQSKFDRHNILSNEFHAPERARAILPLLSIWAEAHGPAGFDWQSFPRKIQMDHWTEILEETRNWCQYDTMGCRLSVHLAEATRTGDLSFYSDVSFTWTSIAGWEPALLYKHLVVWY